jgi:four helix bundle protein
VSNYKLLRVWQKAHELALEVYRLADEFPSREQYGMAKQLRRGAVSVVSNLAEGSGRGTDREFARFVDIARGSAIEMECQLLLAHDLGYIDSPRHAAIADRVGEVSRILIGLRKRLRVS